MIAYEQAYKPAFGRARLAQGSTPSVPPPTPDFLFTGYTGLPGYLETAAVLTVTGAAAWVGIRTGLSEKKNEYLKIAGWIGGVGAALLGLLYVGGKTGVSTLVGIPAMRVSS